MTFKLSDLKFNVELSSSGQHNTRFPRESCVGIALLRPDVNAQKYKLKLMFQADDCEKAKMLPTGFVMARISDCSNALQVLYENEQGENFKGYRLRPMGAYRNEDAIREYQKESGHRYLRSFVELTVSFDELDTKRTAKFPMQYVDILHIKKGLMVLDISKSKIYV